MKHNKILLLLAEQKFYNHVDISFIEDNVAFTIYE